MQYPEQGRQAGTSAWTPARVSVQARSPPACREVEGDLRGTASRLIQDADLPVPSASHPFETGRPISSPMQQCRLRALYVIRCSTHVPAQASP